MSCSVWRKFAANLVFINLFRQAFFVSVSILKNMKHLRLLEMASLLRSSSGCHKCFGLAYSLLQLYVLFTDFYYFVVIRGV